MGEIIYVPAERWKTDTNVQPHDAIVSSFNDKYEEEYGTDQLALNELSHLFTIARSVESHEFACHIEDMTRHAQQIGADLWRLRDEALRDAELFYPNVFEAYSRQAAQQ